MKQFNHELLTVARESRGMSQTDLASIILTDQGHLSRVEQGMISNPSEDLVVKISKALNYPITFFYQKDTVGPINDFFYRKRITLPAKEKNSLEARIQLLRIVFDKFTSSIELPPLKIPNLLTYANFSAKDVALSVREYFGVHRGPVKDIVNILERHGITVLYLDVQSQKFDAITVYTNKNHPIIFLNRNMPNDRKRFSLSHELGHLIMHLPFRYEFEIYEKIKSDPESLEKEADSFASEFLVPSAEIRNDLNNLTYGLLSQLKLYWNVSKRAIVYKANEIGAIKPERYKSLMIELSRRGERVKESFDVEIDQPKLFSEVIKTHKENLGYSVSDMARMVHLEESDLRSVISENDNSKLRIAV